MFIPFNTSTNMLTRSRLSHIAALSGRRAGPCAYTLTPPTPTHPLTLSVFAQNKPALDFTEDPFKDYRYEDPFNIEDPFADDAKKIDPFARPTSVAGFETDDFFNASAINGSFSKPEKQSGRVSAPPVAYDPFSASKSNNNEAWTAWPNDNWAMEDAWTKPNQDAWTNSSKSSTSDWKTDNWANKTDNWATDWDSNANANTNKNTNKNLNETWPTNTLPSKKEKSPKPVKYAKSLVHTIGGIGRSRHNKDKKKPAEVKSTEFLPTEEQQWAWAAAESKRLEAEAEARRKQEDAELQLALAISRQEK